MSTDHKTTIPTDTASGGVEVIETSHHEIHEGDSYVITHSGTKNLAETINVCLTTPAAGTDVHLLIHASGSGVSTLTLNETITATGGSAAAANNRNRNSSNTSSVSGPVTDATISNTGTTLYSLGIGAGQNNGGETRAEQEWVLKAATKYGVVLTSGAASNALKLVLNWYEE